MRIIGTAFILIVVGAIAGVFFLAPKPVIASPIEIRLSSNPYPASIGPSTLVVSLTEQDGTPIDGADVRVSSQMSMGGMGDMAAVPTTGRSSTNHDGLYGILVTWSMMGQWMTTVSATLPDGRTAQDKFQVFVYTTPPRVRDVRTTYVSQDELDIARLANPAKELWIVIPLGAQAMIREGHAMDLVPSELHLSLSGQSTLIIRNDDVVEHNVGPFFVRPGETIRQTFYSTGEFKGTCSIRAANSSVRIYVGA